MPKFHCALLLLLSVHALADRLTYLNLGLDVALKYVPIPPNFQLPGGYYGPRMILGSVTVVGQPSLKRSGDVSANTIGDSEIIEVRFGADPLVLNISDAFIDGSVVSASLRVHRNSLHATISIPATSGCGIQVPTLRIDSFEDVEVTYGEGSAKLSQYAVEQHIREYALPRINGFLSILRQTVEQYAYFFCLNFYRYTGVRSPYLQQPISFLNNATMLG